MTNEELREQLEKEIREQRQAVIEECARFVRSLRDAASRIEAAVAPVAEAAEEASHRPLAPVDGLLGEVFTQADHVRAHKHIMVLIAAGTRIQANSSILRMLGSLVTLQNQP